MEQSVNSEERELRRPTEVGKVVFEIPDDASSSQGHKFPIPLPDHSQNLEKLESTHTFQEIRKSIFGSTEIGKSNIWSDPPRSDVSTIKSSSTLAKTPAKLSKQKLGDVGQYDAETLKEIEARRKTIFASQSELSRVSSIFLKAEIMREMSADKSFSLTTDLSHKSSSRFRLSHNVPVRSMALELPKSANIGPEEAEGYVGVLEGVLDKLELIRYRIPAEVDESWEEEDAEWGEVGGADPRTLGAAFRGRLEGVAEKLQRDRTYIHTILAALAKELRETQRYDCLEREIDHVAKTAEAEHNLEVHHEIWSEQLSQLLSLIDFEKGDSERAIRKWIRGVHESAADIDDAIFFSRSKIGYVRGWEAARLEGQRLKLEEREQLLLDELTELENRQRTEEIVSEEIRAFLQEALNKMAAEYADWLGRFSEDVDLRDEEIEYLRQDIQKAEEQLKKKEKLLAERQAFIDDCSTRRKALEDEKEYWNGVHHAATAIQALWRGKMVRAQLGAYRDLWKRLKKRKKLAIKRRKKIEARRRKLEEKKAAEEAKKKRK